MSTPSKTFSNYFRVTKVNESNARSDPPYLSGYVGGVMFGGLLVSQAVNALITTNSQCVPQTVNYKFISPVRSDVPLSFQIGNFAEAKVSSIRTYQNGRLVGLGHVRYSTEPAYLDSSPFHFPECGVPEDHPDMAEVAKTIEGPQKFAMQALCRFPMEARPVISMPAGKIAIWIRVKQELQAFLAPSDGLAVLLFLSESAFMHTTAATYHRTGIRVELRASLHHSVWIHEANLDPCAWHLVTGECNIVSFDRARLESRIYNQSGKCVLTVMQEGYIVRSKNDMPKL